MKLERIAKNPYLLFSPILIILIVLAFYYKTDASFGDESRYLLYTENLLNGFYSPPAPDIDIGNGPGYSILLMPFVALHLPLISITLMNVVFYFFSMVLLYWVLQQFVPFKYVLIFSLFWALYINAYEKIFTIVPETLALFLISLIVYAIVKAFNQDSFQKAKRYLILSGFFIGYLALTKPIFGYVIIFLLGGNGLLWLINRSTTNYKRSLLVLLVALATTSPYLFYTYKLTDRLFYWSSSGGNNLYTMSSPFRNEYGSWYNYKYLIKDTFAITDLSQEPLKALRKNHNDEIEKVNKYSGIEQDDVFKKIAVDNIKSHPIKFLDNCISNIGRILFNFPYSYKYQTPRTLLRLPFNGIIVVLMIFCILPTIINWRKITYSIRFLLFFGLIYMCGSILGSAETRMFTIIVPILLVWIAYIIQKSIKIKILFSD